MSDKKTVRRDGVEPTTPTLINVVRGYLTMYSSEDPGPGLSMYTSEREFTLVLLDCCARVTEAQTINELRTALGDIVSALGLFLVNGTDFDVATERTGTTTAQLISRPGSCTSQDPARTRNPSGTHPAPLQT